VPKEFHPSYGGKVGIKHISSNSCASAYIPPTLRQLTFHPLNVVAVVGSTRASVPPSVQVTVELPLACGVCVGTPLRIRGVQVCVVCVWGVCIGTLLFCQVHAHIYRIQLVRSLCRCFFTVQVHKFAQMRTYTVTTQVDTYTVQVYTHTQMHAYTVTVQMYTHTHTHTRTHMYTHTHTLQICKCTRTHTCILSCDAHVTLQAFMHHRTDRLRFECEAKLRTRGRAV